MGGKGAFPGLRWQVPTLCRRHPGHLGPAPDPGGRCWQICSIAVSTAGHCLPRRRRAARMFSTGAEPLSCISCRINDPTFPQPVDRSGTSPHSVDYREYLHGRAAERPCRPRLAAGLSSGVICGNSSMFVGIDNCLSGLNHWGQPGGHRRVVPAVDPAVIPCVGASLEVGSDKQ